MMKWGNILALLVIMGAAWDLRIRGVEWPLLHPDEYKISSWASWIEEHSQTFNPAYPGGYFHLVKPVLQIKNALLEQGDDWQVRLGHGGRAVREEINQTFLLRKINVGFALLTILLFYGLAYRVTGSRAGALAAAAFLGLSRLHVEHSHYAETDIAMLFTLTLALYGWTRAHAGGQISWFLASAFLSGLAIGTKYTNLILLPSCVAGGVICFRLKIEENKRRSLVILMLSGLALMLAGWVYTNRHVFEGAAFWGTLQRACHSAYAERSGILGKSAGDPHAVVISNLNVLRENLGDINSIWLGLSCIGIILSLLPRYRRFLIVTTLSGGLYVIYFLYFAPWVRDQEFLTFLPFMAVCIAIGVKACLEFADRMPFRAVAKAVLMIAVVVAALESEVKSLRCSSLFMIPEARVEAMKWLYQHAPMQRMVGVEDYTTPACRLFDSASSIGQIEWMSSTQRAQTKMEFVLRNVSATGRGTVDPRTHALYPDYAANLASFTNQARRLCEWGPRESRFSFAGHQIEWWDVRPVLPEVTLESPLLASPD